jgi:hypothetical protein
MHLIISEPHGREDTEPQGRSHKEVKKPARAVEASSFGQLWQPFRLLSICAVPAPVPATTPEQRKPLGLVAVWIPHAISYHSLQAFNTFARSGLHSVAQQHASKELLLLRPASLREWPCEEYPIRVAH